MPAQIKWTVSDARSVLEARGFNVLAVERTKDGFGTVLRCGNGALVAVYDTGRVLCQGKHIAEARALFAATPADAQKPAGAVAPVAAPPRPSLVLTPPVAALVVAKPASPAPSAGSSVRFVRDVPGPDATVDLPW